jgi:hypothetical protein
MLSLKAIILTAKNGSSIEAQINALLASPAKIAEIRKRLCSLSWFMGRLNEFIARMANAEDKVKGRFWESRFKCQALSVDNSFWICSVLRQLVTAMPSRK